MNRGNIAFCGTALELTERLGKKYLIHITTEKGTETFEANNIENALLSLLTQLRQKGQRF